MKKQKNRKAKRIRHPKYEDYNLSMLEEHKQQGKKLTPPLANLPNLVHSSWHKNALPDVLWAVILAGHLDRADYLNLFREVISAGCGIHNCKDSHVSHSGLALMSESDFDAVMTPLLSRQDVRELLSALLLFDGVPDRNHWERQNIPVCDSKKHGAILAKAVIDHFDHQSEKATDCRWLKVYYAVAVGGLFVSDDAKKQFENYPESEAGSSARAMEATFQEPGFMPGSPEKWCAAFWRECWKKTECVLTEPAKPDVAARKLELGDFFDVYREVSEHGITNMRSMESSDVDPRLDAAFGLVLYSVYLAMMMAQDARAFSAESRIVLRTIVESFVTLKYLAQKDDPSIWLQYRNYGTGKSKSAFLKLIALDSTPSYVGVEDLEMHANADMWMEFMDINLGAWDNKNLRRMAEEVGIKDIYDKYYDWPSGFVHANWSAVRDTVFQLCLNPLHRFHRVPFVPRINMGDTTEDAAKLVNLMLEELNMLYPSFKPRIKTR